MNHLFCFGFGFTASALTDALDRDDWRVTATCRTDGACAALTAAGIAAVPFDGTAPVDDAALSGATHVLLSVPPGADGDPVLATCRDLLVRHRETLRWIGYLSTTGVYGDHQGGWVDETTPLTPVGERGERRVKAEAGWLSLYREYGLPVHVFRLAGIYGPGRNQLETVCSGKARRVVKPGQVFSRIHVEDIAGILQASMAQLDPGAVYNVCDDEAAPPQDVVVHAAQLLDMPPPPEIAFEAAELSPMGRSFYGESKRVSNARIKEQLGIVLKYPTYREGLAHCLAALKAPAA